MGFKFSSGSAMDEKVRASWERALHPETLKTNIITASTFSMAFEMLKSSVVEGIEGFFTNGFESGWTDCQSRIQSQGPFPE